MATKEESMQKALFQPIGDDPPPEPKESDNKPTPDSTEDTIKKLQERIAEQDKKLETQNETLLKYMAAKPQTVVQNPPANVPQEEPEPEMPDPIEDPQAWQNWYKEDKKRTLKKAQEISDNKANALKNEYQQNRKETQIYDKLRNKDPELSKKHFDLVDFIAAKKVKEATSQGLDINTFLFSNEDKFVDDVIDDVKKLLGDESTDDDNDRTSGLSSTSTITKKAPVSNEKTKGFMDSVKELRWRGSGGVKG